MQRSTTIARVLPTMVLLLALARPAFSQPESDEHRWDGLRAKELTTVWVRDTDGMDTKGSLLAFTPDALVLLVNGEERQIARSLVLRIQKRDSLKNGAIIGAITGGVIGVLTAGIADCSVGSRGNGCPGLRASMVAVSAGVYAGLGVGIDALIPGHTTIYQAPPASSAERLAPALAGVQLARISLSW